MYCKNCGEAMNEVQDFCVKCGAKKGKGETFCANCGKPVTPGADICMNCGIALKKSGGKLGGYDKWLLALICFFVGGFGIHNFMMGEAKKGIFRIVLNIFCLLGGLVALIDLIKILCNSYTIDPDALF